MGTLDNSGRGRDASHLDAHGPREDLAHPEVRPMLQPLDDREEIGRFGNEGPDPFGHLAQMRRRHGNDDKVDPVGENPEIRGGHDRGRSLTRVDLVQGRVERLEHRRVEPILLGDHPQDEDVPGAADIDHRYPAVPRSLTR